MQADRADYLDADPVRVPWPLFDQAAYELEALGASKARKVQLLQPLLDKHTYGTMDVHGALYCFLHAVLPEQGIIASRELKGDVHSDVQGNETVCLVSGHTLVFDEPLKGAVASVGKGGIKQAAGAQITLAENVEISWEDAGDLRELQVKLKGVKASKGIGVAVKSIVALSDGTFVLNGIKKHPVKFAKVLHTVAGIAWPGLAASAKTSIFDDYLSGSPAEPEAAANDRQAEAEASVEATGRASPSRAWVCPKCTFVNAGWRTTCEMCQAAASSSAVAPGATETAPQPRTGTGTVESNADAGANGSTGDTDFAATGRALERDASVYNGFGDEEAGAGNDASQARVSAPAAGPDRLVRNGSKFGKVSHL